jgi:hypothetical protein
VIQRASPHADQNVERINLRLRRFRVLQNIGSAVLRINDRFHEFLSLHGRSN